MAPRVCTTPTVAAADEAKTGTEEEAEEGGQEAPGEEPGAETETVDEEVVAVEVRGGAAVAEGVETLAAAGAAQSLGKTDGRGGVRCARGLGVEVAAPARGSGRPRLLGLKV